VGFYVPYSTQDLDPVGNFPGIGPFLSLSHAAYLWEGGCRMIAGGKHLRFGEAEFVSLQGRRS
jgi:hypothetical protein